MQNRKFSQNIILVVVGVCLYAALMNFSSVLSALNSVLGIILPIVVGAILALFLSVPVNGMQKRLVKWTINWKRRPSDSAFRRISFLIVLALILLARTLVFVLLIPELAKSATNAYTMLEKRIPEWITFLQEKGLSNSYIEETLGKLDVQNLLKNSSSYLDSFFSIAATKVTSVVSAVVTFGFGLIIGFYLVLGSERTSRHTRKLIYGFLPDKWADRIYHVARLFQKSFSNFLTGQCLEAVILGTLMFIAFTAAGLSYGALVGVITAFCAIIPYVGAFISCAISIILTLLGDPTLVLRAAIVYLGVQFVENQFIYPRVVGGSVGMPPLYTLIAALLGGKLFGIMGILFFIPIMAVLIELVKEEANQRLSKKHLKF